MKTKEIESIESYFKTENEHWNGYAFSMVCEVLQQGLFDNPEQPLELFSKAVDIFTDHFETPLKAIQLFLQELEREKLNDMQKLFVSQWVYKYVKDSEFEKGDISEIRKLLKSQIENLKEVIEKKKPVQKGIREILKDLMQKEIERFPETIKEMPPAQRVNFLIKLMPYVLPKTESVSCEKDKSSASGFNFSEFLGNLP